MKSNGFKKLKELKEWKNNKWLKYRLITKQDKKN